MARHADDLPCVIQKNDINAKAHKKSVDALAGLNQQSAVLCQFGFCHESAKALCECIRPLQSLDQHSAVAHSF